MALQPVLDPVTKSKVVILRGADARRHYAEVEWRGDPAAPCWGARGDGRGGDPTMAAWLEAMIALPGAPGSFPPPGPLWGLKDPTAATAFAAARDYQRP